jgi:hypothetical protein
VEPLLAYLEPLSHQMFKQNAAEVMMRRPVADGLRSLSSAGSLDAQGKQPQSAATGAEAEPKFL